MSWTHRVGGVSQPKVENLFELFARLDREKAARDPEYAARLRRLNSELSSGSVDDTGSPNRYKETGDGGVVYDYGDK